GVNWGARQQSPAAIGLAPDAASAPAPASATAKLREAMRTCPLVSDARASIRASLASFEVNTSVHSWNSSSSVHLPAPSPVDRSTCLRRSSEGGATHWLCAYSASSAGFLQARR